MPVHNLHKIFKPRSVAVIGASDHPGKVGHTVLANLKTGFSGPVFPVNPNASVVQGLPAVSQIGQAEAAIDLAVICTPAPGVPALIQECGEVGIRGIIILSAGFREVGAEGRALEDRVRAAAARFPDMRIIGPNSLGVMAPFSGLNASFAAISPQQGNIALLSQSGALCTAILDWAAEQSIGFSYFVSIGNMLDVGFGDLLDYCGADPHTEAIALYVESIQQARQFMSAARALTRHKPIVVYKAGRFAQSAQAAASHTGALAGVDAVYDAAFQRAGAVRISELDDLFDCAELLSRRRLPSGPRLAIITNAGGPGVIATDALLARDGTLAAMSEKLRSQLDTLLPPCWSHGNPIDVLGDAPPERFGDALEHTLADAEIDAALVLLTPQAMTDPLGAAKAVAGVARRSSKPVLTAWMGGRMVREGAALLREQGLPTFATPEHAIRSLMYLTSYRRNLEGLYQTPHDTPWEVSLDRVGAKETFRRISAATNPILSEQDSKELLAAYGIPITQPVVARSADEAVAEAQRQGFPVVLKINSPDITHKTDVEGVALNLPDEAMVRKGYERVLTAARVHRPEARLDGVTVQRMIMRAAGVELILGAKQDPVFGAVMMVGMGGVAAELLNDRALELPPLNDALARRMLESLRLWPLLAGYRHQPAVNTQRLIEILIRFSYFVTDFPEIIEIDINPLWASASQLVALDARMIIDQTRVEGPKRPGSHLAICPYPARFVRQINLADGTPLVLRPVRPEDEPAWLFLHEQCSTESIRARFRSVFKHATHDLASRFCFLDYDRDLSIVAETQVDGQPRLVAVASLSADPDHESAEFAVLVHDVWQGRGLGSLLTEYCLAIARDWQLARVVAETDPLNTRMIKVFTRLGFALRQDTTAGVVRAEHLLSADAPGGAADKR